MKTLHLQCETHKQQTCCGAWKSSELQKVALALVVCVFLDMSELNAPVPACGPHYPSPPLCSPRHSCGVPPDHVHHSHCLSEPEGQVDKVIKLNNQTCSRVDRDKPGFDYPHLDIRTLDLVYGIGSYFMHYYSEY